MAKTKIKLSDHFTYGRLIRFVLPAIIMNVFSSLYFIVDGVFVSNFVNKNAFASINLIMPVLSAIATIGFMIGSGGSAIISKTLGEGKNKEAQQYFSLMMYFIIIVSVTISIFGAIFIKPIAVAVGAKGEILEYCIMYGRIMFISLPAYMLQYTHQCFFAAAEKPKLSLLFMVVSGVTNIILDALFILVFHWGLLGAAIASVIGQVIGGIGPIIYFACKNKSLLRLTKPKLAPKVLLHACTNGSSEMVTNIATSVMNIIFNFQLLRIVGESGVVAYGVIMYVFMIFTNVFFGYSICSSTIVGYHYGAQNTDELKNMFKKGLVLMAIFGSAMLVLSQALNVPLVKIFVNDDIELFNMTSRAFRIYAISFIFMGFNIWASSFFTALGNGLISAIISLLRAFVFQIAAVFLLPLFMGLDGVWLAIVVAEFLSLFASGIFLFAYRKRYNYVGKKLNES